MNIQLNAQQQRRLATFRPLLDSLVAREGIYSDDPDDAGGETMYGITVGVARKFGYTGEMRTMDRETAIIIYLLWYIIEPGFDLVYLFHHEIGEELIDTGVNMGQPIAAMFFQRVLNAFNDRGKHYPDVKADGLIGPRTMNAFKCYLQLRGKQGATVMLRALNALQGERYIDIAEKRGANEKYTYGWFANRVAIPA